MVSCTTVRLCSYNSKQQKALPDPIALRQSTPSMHVTSHLTAITRPDVRDVDFTARYLWMLVRPVVLAFHLISYILKIISSLFLHSDPGPPLPPFACRESLETTTDLLRDVSFATGQGFSSGYIWSTCNASGRLYSPA